MPETRVDIPRLLEDLAQGYKSSLEEAIITEVVANALDSGASIIRFQIDRSNKILTITDNGQGMTTNYGQGTKEEELEMYHNIAESGKVKGTGIGFAGLGAKLALLIAKEVITETKKGASHAATRWYLNKEQKSAPYEYIFSLGG